MRNLSENWYINLAGEITSKATIDYAAVARQTVKKLFHTSSDMNLMPTCVVSIDAQSPILRKV